MEHANILIDTSIVIEHLRKRDKQKSILYHLIDTYNLHTATMVEFELFAGATDDRKRQDVEDILRVCIILPFSSEVARQAAEIYQGLKQNNEIIEIRDIIIAATAILYDVPVMTLNQDHFQRIENLRVIAPPRTAEL